MPKSDNQKKKIFYTLYYLRKNSSRDHLVSATELIDMLKNDYDISVSRKTVYEDIHTLLDLGYDIDTVRGKYGGFYMGSQMFELPELKLLIDSVQSSRYLTEKKSRELIEKLCNLVNEQDASLMKRNVVISDRVKSMNESIYYNVDAIQEAILKNKQISFTYFDYDINGKRKYRDRSYVASPYGLMQDNENCYLLAFSERHGVTHYRVDRMDKINMLTEKRLPCKELSGKSIYEHAKKQFQMFSGNEETVRLRFSNHLANVVFDRFGTDIMMIPDGDEHFVVRVSVDVSPMFLSWIIGFGNQAQILYPQNVIDQCKALLDEVSNQYKS